MPACKYHIDSSVWSNFAGSAITVSVINFIVITNGSILNIYTMHIYVCCYYCVNSVIFYAHCNLYTVYKVFCYWILNDNLKTLLILYLNYSLLLLTGVVLIAIFCVNIAFSCAIHHIAVPPYAKMTTLIQQVMAHWWLPHHSTLDYLQTGRQSSQVSSSHTLLPACTTSPVNEGQNLGDEINPWATVISSVWCNTSAPPPPPTPL